jgi:hypothetical protein
MSSKNAEQVAEWNGALGQRWADSQRQINGLFAALTRRALKCAAAQAG